MPKCYLTLAPLPPSVYPAHVRREDGITLLTLDPRATKADAALGAMAVLTSEEAAIYTAAYRSVLPERITDCDDLVLLYVPPTVRVPGEQPIQGGLELLRRYEAGLMPVEMEMIAAEVLASA